MSCQHGNHTQACDICDDLDAEYQSGYFEATRKLQAEIERVTDQRDRLLVELRWAVSGLDDYYRDHATEKVNSVQELIAEMEAKG